MGEGGSEQKKELRKNSALLLNVLVINRVTFAKNSNAISNVFAVVTDENRSFHIMQAIVVIYELHVQQVFSSCFYIFYIFVFDFYKLTSLFSVRCRFISSLRPFYAKPSDSESNRNAERSQR